MAAKIITNFIAKQIFKQKGAIANNKAVKFSADALESRLKNLGIDPNAITSEKELNQILNLVKQAENQAFNQRFGDMLGGSKFDRKGEVFDMQGKKINPSKGIMGGKEINEQTLKEGLMKTDNPFSDLVKTTDQGPKTLKQREAEVLANMEKNNKEAVARIKNRKMIKDAVDNASPGFVSGDRKYNAQLVADDLAEKRFGKDFYDLDQKQQTDLYGEALDGLDDSDKFAQGGRAGFKDGLLSMLDIKAEGRKSGKNQIKGAPEGITADEESINAIIKADIPISQKINLLADYQYGKGRTRIEDKGQEIYMDEGGFKNRNIGAEFNRGGEGLGGKIMYNLESGDPTLKIRFKKSFAEGGRIGLKDGMDRRTFMKIMGGLATLPIVGKFAKGAKLAAPAVKKVAELTAPALDKIIETVMSAGKLVSQSGRRLKELTTKKKLKDVEVEEDMLDGPSYTIKTKDKTIYYKPGRQDEMGFDDDIIEVIEDTVTKKASGGVARMLGE